MTVPRTRQLALAAVSWLPLVAVLVLVGLAVGWWATGLGVAVLAIVAVAAARAIRQIRDRPKPHPAAVREELKELDRRAARWIKVWTFVMLGLTVLFTLLLLVAAFELRS